MTVKCGHVDVSTGAVCQNDATYEVLIRCDACDFELWIDACDTHVITARVDPGEHKRCGGPARCAAAKTLEVSP